MAEAKYSIMVPKQDNAGNPINVTDAAYHYLVYQAPIQVHGAHVDPNKWGHWNGRREEYDLINCYAEDTPESDSYIKQLGAYVGEVANQEVVFVTKTGKQVNTWPIRNPSFHAVE